MSVLRHSFAALSLATILSLSGNVTAAEDPHVKALKGRLDYIFKNDKLDKSSLGIEVYSLSHQKSLYSVNPKTTMLPASAVKLLTAAVVLRKLGPDFKYNTEVFFEKSLKKDVLEGNIYLVGSGDPSLVSERMFLLAGEVSRTGVKEIKGDLIVDDWAFDQNRYSSARLKTKTDRPYNAPIGALSFNYNTTTVYFRPGEKIGDPVRVIVEPDTGYIKVKNTSKTAKAGSKFSINAKRIESTLQGDVITVQGSMPLGGEEKLQYFNVLSPAIYSGFALRHMLEQRGIKFSESSQIVHNQKPRSALKVADQESLPVRDIVTLMNKFSNNFIAESLIKTLGREIKGAPGTTKNGLTVLNEEILRMDVGTTGLKIVSGSGLTRENKMSARQFIEILNIAYLDFEVLPELLTSLPIAGRDGTLKRRMKGSKAFGRLRAKTGSIDGVAALVGIVQSQGGELLAFSVLVNDRRKPSYQLRKWQDYFGQALAEFSRKTVMRVVPSPDKASMESKGKR